MDPVHRLVQVEWVPSELVGNVVQFVNIGGHASVIRVGILCNEVLVRCRRQDTVDPGLLVFVSRSRERRAGELLGVQTIRCLLRRVLTDGQSSFDGLGPGRVSGTFSSCYNTTYS